LSYKGGEAAPAWGGGVDWGETSSYIFMKREKTALHFQPPQRGGEETGSPAPGERSMVREKEGWSRSPRLPRKGDHRVLCLNSEREGADVILAIAQNRKESTAHKGETPICSTEQSVRTH